MNTERFEEFLGGIVGIIAVISPIIAIAVLVIDFSWSNVLLCLILSVIWIFWTEHK